MERNTIRVGAAILVLAVAILMRNRHWWEFVTVAVFVVAGFLWMVGVIRRRDDPQ